MSNPAFSAQQSLTAWWNPVELPIDSGWCFQVGPLVVYLQRSEDEWWLASEQQEETPENYLVISKALDALPIDLSANRFVFRRSPATVCLKPRLLDRPLVVKTNYPVHIPPGESITFYISSPVCVQICLPESDIVLQELPVMRLSDTWFGPSTQIGELCYAAKTHARNVKDDVPLRPHRAVTPVTIDNRSETLLAIEKLSIPLPFLAVYGQTDGTLWTDPVWLKHNGSEGLANLTVGNKTPSGQLLNSARHPLQRGGLVRAFTSMFSDN